MGTQETTGRKHICLGLLAHVDAGKTTLSEGLLYLTGAVRTLGRVDHQNAFLDTFAMERRRGITIFSKQAVFSLGDLEVTLLDTPGHVDFSAEMERTLQVLDAAILVISGTDGVQGHTMTLWHLLRRHHIPTFIFVNKMDLPGADRQGILDQLRRRFGDSCVDFGGPAETIAETAAMTDEALLERYLNGGAITEEDVAAAIQSEGLTPVCFGSALQLSGVEELLELLRRYARGPVYGAEFGAKVFKIARDGQGNRLTYLKVTGGTLHVKDILSAADGSWQEKVNQIRIDSGAKFRTVDQAAAGTVCAVTGLTSTRPGQGLGAEKDSEAPFLEPVLNYRLLLPEGCDAHTMLQKLRILEEEDPALRVLWKESLGEIHLQLMGEVQLEVLREVIAERFGVSVEFDAGNIVYRETVEAPVIGIGHFEPLRHYAEVHLLIEPLPRGSGVQYASVCDTDTLDLNWQRLILTHLMEKQHAGVLTGSAVTDVKYTLLTGRAHLKHTEGGDFRQATYRAVRQGLMQARSRLLEPWYEFRLEVPQENVGRAMNDIQRMGGSFEPPELAGDGAVLSGSVSVAAVRGYWTEVAAYTKGRGHLFCTLKGYEPCHNEEEVVAALGYDAERDTLNPADSVFCTHGAGRVIPWREVAEHAHCDSGMLRSRGEVRAPVRPASGGIEGDRELLAIFERTYGPVKNRGMDALAQSRNVTDRPGLDDLAYVQKDDVLVVDGYNIIFSWEELKAAAAENFDAARADLIRILCNYQGMRQCRVILVFDAYRVKGGPGSCDKEAGVEIVYTREGETADAYIEKLSYELGKNHRVKVATGDGLEQLIVLGHGAQRLSARELKWEVEQVQERISAFLKQQNR